MDTTNNVLRLTNVGKTFETPRGSLTILEDVNCVVKKGEKVAIIGPSGSGKSTLLSLIGLLDAPSSGSIEIADVQTGALSEPQQAQFRNKRIGFIFQSFELIAPFTVEENIAAPVEIAKQQVPKAEITDLLTKLKLDQRRTASPRTLSGGEKQRVAIGRALIHTPDIILADEPTGSLDRSTGEAVLSLLLEAVEQSGTTLLIITHDESIAGRMDRVFELKGKTLHERG